MGKEIKGETVRTSNKQKQADEKNLKDGRKRHKGKKKIGKVGKFSNKRKGKKTKRGHSK